MGFFGTPEFKVGVLVVAVSALIAMMSLRVSQNPTYLTASKDVWFYIDDASGLVKNSNVAMAGIPVGIIKDIKLENGQAKVDMLIRSDTPMSKSARVEIRPNGILGDKHVEIISGDMRDPPLANGDQILVVDDRASVDRLLGEVSKITKTVSSVAENIKSATEGDKDKPLGRIISNIERITKDLADLSGDKKEELSEIISNIHNVSSTLDELINDPSQDGFKAAWKDALKSLRKIEGTLKNAEEITAKINRGEGTIGKLVNDETTVEELNTAITGINNFLDTGSKLQTAVDFHSNYLTGAREAKSYLTLRIQPGLDRFYELGLVDDSSGVLERVTTKSTTNGASETTLSESKRWQDRYKYNALFAKNYYNFTIKGGIMENAGGAGVDLYMLKRKLKWSLEAFDFEKPQVRLMGRYNIYHGIYLTGGGEDLFGQSTRGINAFVGAGLFLTNDDFKMLVSKLPF